MNLDNTPVSRRSRGHRPSIRAVAAAALLSCAALLGACSDDPPVRVPPGSQLTIAPEENTWRITDRRDAQGRCFIDDSFYVDLPLLISLRDGGGVPIGEADIGVYVNLAENTFSGSTLLQLYDDLNGNGVVDEDTELVSGSEDEAARVRTSKYGGEHLMLLRVNLSCPYRSDVFAFVEGFSALSSVEVVLDCEDDRDGCVLPEE